MIEYIIPVVVVVIPLYGIYYTITTKNKLNGAGIIITGSVLLEQFENEDDRQEKTEIRYQKEVKKQVG